MRSSRPTTSFAPPRPRVKRFLADVMRRTKPRGISHIRAEGTQARVPNMSRVGSYLIDRLSGIGPNRPIVAVFLRKSVGVDSPRTAKYNRFVITDQAHILWQFRPDFRGSFHRRPSQPRVAGIYPRPARSNAHDVPQVVQRSVVLDGQGSARRRRADRARPAGNDRRNWNAADPVFG